METEICLTFKTLNQGKLICSDLQLKSARIASISLSLRNRFMVSLTKVAQRLCTLIPTAGSIGGHFPKHIFGQISRDKFMGLVYGGGYVYFIPIISFITFKKTGPYLITAKLGSALLFSYFLFLSGIQ